MWHMALNSLEKASSITDEDEDDDEDNEDPRRQFYSGRRVEKKPKHEWVLLDELGGKRFTHDGDTIIPGAGPRWKHAKGETSAQASEPDSIPTATAVAEVKENDDEELPWQVIAILDVDMVQQLLWSSENRKQKVRDAKLGKNASTPSRASLEGCSAPGNWLFRVVNKDGVNLFSSPNDTFECAGKREFGNFLKGFKLGQSEDWLCLDSSEDYAMDRASAGRFRTDHFFNASFSQRQLWVRLSNLEEVSAEDTAVLDAKILSYESPALGEDGQSMPLDDLFDRPFIPRMEDGDAQPHGSVASVTDDEVISTIQAEKSFPVVKGIPLGVTVELAGLTSCDKMQYNGVTAVVISPIAHGTQAVRLDLPYSGTIINCNPNNFVFLEADSNSFKEGSIENAASVLGITMDQLGVTANESKGWGFGGLSVSQRIGCALRAALRDVGSEVLGGQQAAREAAAVLLAMKQIQMPTESSVEGSEAISPDIMLRCGALGGRAAACIVSALSPLSADERNTGIFEIRKLLKAELKRASMAASHVFMNDCEESSGGDELLIRLGLIIALLDGRRESEAFSEAKDALYSQEVRKVTEKHVSPAIYFLLGRCMMRLGQRAEGLTQLELAEAAAVDTGKNVQWLKPLYEWGRREAALMLRAHKGSERCRSVAVDAYCRGSFDDAVALYARSLEIIRLGCNDDKLGRATGLADRAGCHRRARRLDAAVEDLDAALRLFPRYSRALFRRAVCLLEAGRADEAIDGFKDLYRVDRNWPMLSEWLVRSFSLRKRQKAGYKGAEDTQYDNPTTGGVERDEKPSDAISDADMIAREVDHYTVLGVTTDATEKQLKTAYRMRSLKYHPDRKDGNTAAFQRINHAYQILSDPEKRRAYDDGSDIKVKRGGRDDSDESEEDDEEHKTTMREEVEREFYPERYHFWPFGDPFVYKRKFMAQKSAKQGKNSSRSAWRNDEDDDWR